MVSTNALSSASVLCSSRQGKLSGGNQHKGQRVSYRKASRGFSVRASIKEISSSCSRCRRNVISSPSLQSETVSQLIFLVVIHRRCDHPASLMRSETGRRSLRGTMANLGIFAYLSTTWRKNLFVHEHMTTQKSTSSRMIR
ncbi:hypothetical protein YC2023_077796 [Brassica napus]